MHRSGLAQLTLVEHALCPLDDKLSLRDRLVFETGYFRTDQHGHAKFVKVAISAWNGLSANDEFFLWGLLALTLAQRNPTIEFWATPYFCLKQLECLTSESKGGANYAQFRAVIKRLSGVIYKCEQFYDPIHRECRDRGFGFLSYDLPIDPASSRAWRIVWNPLFFEYCRAAAGSLRFDLPTYRTLDCASRRLLLLLSKIFYRCDRSPSFDVWHLAVNVLGFSPSVKMHDLKIKLVRCIEKLLAIGVLRLPPTVSSSQDLFEKKGTGSYGIRFYRGKYFDKDPDPLSPTCVPSVTDSPLYDPLKSIGFSDARIRAILRRYKPSHVQIWSDVTLAKIERHGRDSFTNCPEAFFMDNIREADAGRRTPPDWWRKLQKKEARRRWQEEWRRDETGFDHSEFEAAWYKARSDAFKKYVKEEVGNDLYQRSISMLLPAFQARMGYRQALDAAIAEAERHFMAGFNFPDLETWAFERRFAEDARAQQ